MNDDKFTSNDPKVLLYFEVVIRLMISDEIAHDHPSSIRILGTAYIDPL
jgi:hypothetical protein